MRLIWSYRLLALCEEKYKKREKEEEKSEVGNKKLQSIQNFLISDFFKLHCIFKYWTESKYNQEGLCTAIKIKMKFKPLLWNPMYENLDLVRGITFEHFVLFCFFLSI